MLILSRKSGESITIRLEEGVHPEQPVGQFFQGQPIKVCVHNIANGVAQLGISAHRELNIVRDELLSKTRPVPTDKPCHPPDPTPSKLSQLSTELSSFNAFYTCFCDTLAKVLVAGQPLDACTVEGVNRSCRWLEHRLAELQAELESMSGKLGNA